MPKLIRREISASLKSWLFKNRALIVYGARQVGKTTLITQFLQKQNLDYLYLDCDLPRERQKLTNSNLEDLQVLIGDHSVIFIDEAQRVSDIGLTLKILVDRFPQLQVIASGSSSLDLANKISESLTGRKMVFHLYPLSLRELLQPFAPLELEKHLETLLRYGSYPAVIKEANPDKKRQIIEELAFSSLYKDILEFQSIKNPQILQDLLQALALQIGSQVSYTELSKLLGIDKNTIQAYVDLLEKGLVIFRLPPYFRNKRKELRKLRKVYFYDTGIRNALLNNFNPLRQRNDIGALWENFVIAERIKLQNLKRQSVRNFFWRTYDQTEIDWIEESGDQLNAYEIKWSPHRKTSSPPSWQKLYPQASWQLITPKNILPFLT